jgi:cytoskeleton protein RodZ
LVISATEPGGEAGTPLETVPQQEASADSESATPSVTAADTNSADAPTELIEPVDEVSETTAPSSELVSNTEPEPEPESAQSAPVAEADAVEAPVVKVPPPATPSPVSGNDVLALSSDEDSWIEISDALGNRLMFDMLRPGDSRTLRGTAPFRVFLGNAPPVSLEVNGKPVSRPRVSSRNTARFVVESDGDQHQ